MSDRLSSTVSQFCSTFSQGIQAYRFMNNESVKVGELIMACTKLEPSCFQGRDLLVPIDETHITLGPLKRSRFKYEPHGPGTWVGASINNKSVGFSLFTGLVVDEDSNLIYGLSDVVHHCLRRASSDQKLKEQQRVARRLLPFEQVSPYAWTMVAANSHAQLKDARGVTYLLDRGGDNFNVIRRILDLEGADILVRLRFNRKGEELDTGLKSRLNTLFEARAWQSSRPLDLPGLDHYSSSSGTRKQRKARKTVLRLRYLPFIPDPTGRTDSDEKAITRPLYAIEVKEDPQYVPETESPVCWRLLTSRTIENLDQAWHIVDLYLKRWIIEQLFRLLKKKGFDIESTQLKSPKAIVKQTIMAMTAAARVLKLDQAKKAKEPLPIETTFDAEEQKCLDTILPSLEGKTQKLKNPYQPSDLRWAAWIIARLGGWKGYASQRPPGPITFKRGLEKFETILWTAELLRNKHEK